MAENRTSNNRKYIHTNFQFMSNDYQKLLLKYYATKHVTSKSPATYKRNLPSMHKIAIIVISERPFLTLVFIALYTNLFLTLT